MNHAASKRAFRFAGALLALLALWSGATISAADAVKGSRPSAPFRFSLPAESVSASNSVAEPGHVLLASALGNPNLEIVNWVAAPSPSEHVGEFIVRFVAPIILGTVIAYEPGEVSVAVNNTWLVLPPGLDQGRALQVLPAPTNALVEAVRFRITARALQQPDQRSSFQAQLQFATFLPVRAINLASSAQAAASSSAPGLSPKILIDGRIDPGSNFSTATGKVSSVKDSDWLTLTWDSTQSVRGMALFRGAADAGLGEPRVEIFNEPGDPASAGTNGTWQPAPARTTTPGQFRANQFLVLLRPAETRAVRLLNTDGAGGIQLGEWAALRLLGNAPAPAASPLPSTREWAVPSLKPGSIQVDGRDEDWPSGRTNGFALAWDEERLYLLYQARGPEARFENPGTNSLQLFHSGDALDLQFRTTATSASASDVERRIILSSWKGQPLAVLYESRTEDLLVVPTVFTSSSKTVSFDKAAVVPEAKVIVRRDNGTLTVEASLPLSVCGLAPGTVRQVRGDIGRIMSGAGRTYWASPATNRVADLADAAELHPQAWGVFRFDSPAR
jgi:hypothetical protein